MQFRRIKFLQFALMGLIVLSALDGAHCYQLCAADSGVVNSSQIAICSVVSHNFVHSEIVFSALFILPVSGVFIILILKNIPAGFIKPPLRPPRYSG